MTQANGLAAAMPPAHTINGLPGVSGSFTPERVQEVLAALGALPAALKDMPSEAERRQALRRAHPQVGCELRPALAQVGGAAAEIGLQAK